MRSPVKLILFIAIQLLAQTFANCQQSPSIDIWDKLPQGVSVKVLLSGNSLTSYIKNNSRMKREILGESQHLVMFLFVGSDGKLVPLKSKADIDGDQYSKWLLKAITIPQEGEEPFKFEIELTSNEVNFVKLYPVLCRFRVSSPLSKEPLTIESTPRMLK